MDTVTVDKIDLLSTLQENRGKHKATFEEASENYRAKVVEALRERADKIDAGEEIDTSFRLPKPEDHTEDYDDAIEAVTWHDGETIELHRHSEFKQWVLNKWDWDRAFLTNTSIYTSAHR